MVFQRYRLQFYFILDFILLAPTTLSIELTFELPDNANQCFYDLIKKGEESTVEFQVVTGGQYDVDMSLKAPNGKVLYKDVKKQYDTFTWTADVEGDYEVCFSNEFSTFSHKIVYMDWIIGDEDANRFPGSDNAHQSAMTQMESSASEVHEKLKKVEDYQTHHRLREARGRQRAEDLNERVLWWSVGQAAVIVTMAVGQVIILRSFFSDKRTSGM